MPPAPTPPPPDSAPPTPELGSVPESRAAGQAPNDPPACEAGLPAEAGFEEAVEEAVAEAAREAATARSPLWARLLGLALVLVALVVIGRMTGLAEVIGDPERLRSAVDAAGPWGVLLLIAAFTLGLFIQVPGIVFATAAILCYGRLGGGFLAYFGAVISVSVVFSCVRAVGGQALGEIKKPWVQKVLAQIDDHPLRTVTLLRLVFWSSPQLNYALALTKVRFRDHLLGTMIGLIPIKIAVAFGIQEAIDVLRELF